MTEWQPQRKPATDWWGRGLAILALLVAGVSLGWQVHEYQDSLREQVLTRVTMIREVENDKPEPTGNLQIEVVNIGQHPIFIKRILLATTQGGDEFKIQASPEIKSKWDEEARLEPGMNAFYDIEHWNFAHDQLTSTENRGGRPFSISVETTRGTHVEENKVATVAWSVVVGTKNIEVEEAH